MKERLFALLGIESGEESMVLWLLTQSVFTGVFFGAFDISAHSLFLSIFDEKMMARGYVVSGVAGIILTSLYTLFQSKLKFRNFSVANLFAITLITFFLWFLLEVAPSKLTVFIVFIMLGPLNILAALGFWGTAGRLFTLRQGKRLFGLVDSGLIAGVILSCYTVPVILSFNFESRNILLISASSILASTAIQFIIGSRWKLESARNERPDERTGDSVKMKSVVSILLKNRYTIVMAVFVLLSVMTAFFVQYSFMAVTREQYPSEEDMARFLGIFTGSMMIFTLLVKLLAFSYLIRNYGLRICLAIAPVLIVIFTAVAILLGISMGYTPESASGFMIFFLILALSRLFSKSLKDSIESPSFKVIYQTIDEKVRYNVQSGLDGTVNEIAALTSGLLLAGLGLLSFIRLIHFSFVLLVIIVLWIFVSFMLYNEYRKSIRMALETAGDDRDIPAAEDKHTGIKSRFCAHLVLKRDYFSLISGINHNMKYGRERKYLEAMITQTKNNNDHNLIPVFDLISKNEFIDSELRMEFKKTADELRQKSVPKSKQEFASTLMMGTRTPQSAEILRLLRDISTDSRRFAIYIIGKFGITEMIPEVCECLGNPSLETDAAAVLTYFGDRATGELTRYYMASGDKNICRLILRILSRIHSDASKSFLFSRLWSNSRELKEAAVRGLLSAEFRPAEEEKDRLHQLISDVIGLMSWNLSAKVCLRKQNDTFLMGILDRDTMRWKTFLFDLLSVAYDPVQIARIRENLEKDTVESGNFALEMIDLVIDESIKAKVIALLDIVPDEEKLKNLWHFFPGEIPEYNQLIDDIINRDYNLINIWTKACTIRSMRELRNKGMAESACALMFSPETILREEAARLISASDMILYNQVAQRIPDPVRIRLDEIANGSRVINDLVYEKITFLSKHFKGIPEEELLSLSEKMIFTRDSGFEPVSGEDCIVWPLSGVSGKAFVCYGNDNNGNIINKSESGSWYFLNLEAVEEFTNRFPERSAEVLGYIEQYEY